MKVRLRRSHRRVYAGRATVGERRSEAGRDQSYRTEGRAHLRRRPDWFGSVPQGLPLAPGALLHRGVVAAKTLVLIFQLFPQVPLKPLPLITREPSHRHITFDSAAGTVVADLFVPQSRPDKRHPAIILAHAVQIPPVGVKPLRALEETLARLGYVVLFPRLQALDRGDAILEEPEMYVDAFSYLQERPEVDQLRISYLGLSVGSSLSLIGATSPRIRRQVHALVFFGGYYDIFDYLTSMRTASARCNGRLVPWHPSSEARRQFEAVLKEKGAMDLLPFSGARAEVDASHVRRRKNVDHIQAMQRYNPAAHVKEFLAPIYVLDDKDDRFVPWVESEKLVQALPKSQVKAVLLTNVFRHVMPGPGGISRLLRQFVAIYAFFYKTLSAL